MYYLRFETEDRLLGEDNFTTEAIGSILFDDTHNEQYDQLVGKIKCTRVDIDRAYNNGVSAKLVLDHSGELFEFLNLFSIDIDGDYTLTNSDWCNDLLVINSIEILPKHRGHGLTKKVIEMTIRSLISKAEVVSLIAQPLQSIGSIDKEWLNKMCYQNLTDDIEIAQSKLVKLYMECGFKTYKGSSLMVRVISDDYTLM